MPPRRLLTYGHSYCVALNRRLARAVQAASAGRWEVTAAGPAFMKGDLRPIPFEPDPAGGYTPVPVPAYLTGQPHLMVYGPAMKRLLRESWHLVHCWEEPYVLAGFQAARWTPAGVPLVYFSFQNIAKHYPAPVRWMEAASLRRAAGWVAAGRTVAVTLEAKPAYNRRPHRVIPLGVDDDRFRPDPAVAAAVRQALGWGPGPPVVGYLGRFIPAKGLGMLTRALDAVAAPWRALFVGGGPMEAELRAWAARHGDCVRIVTGVPHDGVPAYLAAMDVLAAPSQTTPAWREQLGRMLIEAFASGVAVVASDSGEIPHVVADAGVVLSEADEPAWTAALGELVCNTGRRAALAAAGRDRMTTHYRWDVVGRAHVAFFDEILGGA